MSARFQLTSQATEDLDTIWRFIHKDSKEAADRVEIEIVASCRRLAQFPLIGHSRRDITPLQLRFWTLPKYPNYVIVYRPDTDLLQVIAILQGKQSVEEMLKDRIGR